MNTEAANEGGPAAPVAEWTPRILIVDDQPVNIQILAEALRDTARISIATSGAAALAILGNQVKPDLIILDVMMPEMDGFELCRRLKEDRATWDIPVIFLTALTEREDEARGLALGAVDFITKPFTLNLVRLRVRNQLQLKRQRDLLREREVALTAALAKVQLLSGMLPLCANCKRIRNDQGYWEKLESYLEAHSEAEVTHGICPECIGKLYPEVAERLLATAELKKQKGIPVGRKAHSDRGRVSGLR